MSGPFRGCIDEAAAKGEITPEAAARARKTYDSAHANASDAFGPADADRVAAEAVMAQMESAALEAKRRRALMIRARETIIDGMNALKGERGYVDPLKIGVRRTTPGIIERVFGRKPPPPPDGFADEGVTPAGSDRALFARGLELLVENKPGLSGAPFSSIQGRYVTIVGQAHAQIASIIERFESKTGFDKPGRAALTNLVREAFGEDTGDHAARMMAKAWEETAESLRLMFNAAGGSVGRMEGWGMPQTHDSYLVRRAGREAWKAHVWPKIDRAKMLDETTGHPFTDAGMSRALDDVWNSIATEGRADVAPQERTGLSALAKRRADTRFLIFKSADDWMEYQAQFGDADAYSTMLGHIDELSRDIAQMQILGPDPARQFDWLRKRAVAEAMIEEAAGRKGAKDAAESYIKTAENMLGHFTSELARPVNTKLAQWGANFRNLATAAQIGSALLSDLPTAPVFGAYARTFSGLSRTGDVRRLTALLNPADGTARQIARRSGFIVEQASDGLVRATQDNQRLLTVGERMEGGRNALFRRMPIAVLRLQGLTAWDSARKRSFQAEFMGALHDRRGKSIADLRAGDAEDKAFAVWLKARGFSEADWTAIRATPAWEPRPGVQFLRPMDVADENLRFRLGEAVETETRFAVPTGTLWARAKLIGNDRPGTFFGEMRRNWAQFRSFSLTASQLWISEMMLRGQARGMTPLVGTAAYLGPMIFALTVGGALNVYMREIAKGNDPKSAEDPRFWIQAMLQGGGLGVLGDAIYATEARNGKSSQAAAFGPVGQLVADTYDASAGNGVEIYEGLREGEDLPGAVESANIGRDAVGMGRSWTPGGNIWWLRAAYNRAVLDQLQRIVDPEAEKDFERKAKRLETKTGQEQWWPVGEAQPVRAPDYAAPFDAAE